MFMFAKITIYFDYPKKIRNFAPIIKKERWPSLILTPYTPLASRFSVR